MRTIISMKMINCNALFYCYEGMWLITYISELDRFHGFINLFYHRLGDELYNILDEDDYFNEDD
jgi:hypothetical protein